MWWWPDWGRFRLDVTGLATKFPRWHPDRNLPGYHTLRYLTLPHLYLPYRSMGKQWAVGYTCPIRHWSRVMLRFIKLRPGISPFPANAMVHLDKLTSFVPAAEDACDHRGQWTPRAAERDGGAHWLTWVSSMGGSRKRWVSGHRIRFLLITK